MKKITVCLFSLIIYFPIQAFGQSSYWDDLGDDYGPTKKYTPRYSQKYSPKYTTKTSYKDDELPKKHNLEIGLEYSDYKYREPHMDHPISIAGKKQGVNVKYTRNSVTSSQVTPEDPTFASLEFRYMNGKADYNGWWSHSVEVAPGVYENEYTPLEIENEKDFYMDFAFKFGRYYQVTASSKLWPYIGFAYRFLQNGKDQYVDMGNGEMGFLYKRTSHYFYAPLGANWALDMSDSVRLTFNAEFDWLLRGLQNSHLGEGASRESSVKQDKGYGLRASVRLEKDMGKWGIFIEPFWRYWKIQNSKKDYFLAVDEYGNPIIDPGTGYYLWYVLQEPFNDTREYGLRAGITF